MQRVMYSTQLHATAKLVIYSSAKTGVSALVLHQLADLEEGNKQALLSRLAQDLAENFDGLAAGEQEAHGHPCYTRHLNVVVHVHQLVH